MAGHLERTARRVVRGSAQSGLSFAGSFLAAACEERRRLPKHDRFLRQPTIGPKGAVVHKRLQSRARFFLGAPEMAPQLGVESLRRQRRKRRAQAVKPSVRGPVAERLDGSVHICAVSPTEADAGALPRPARNKQMELVATAPLCLSLSLAGELQR